VSDGIETCESNLVAAAKHLHEQNIVAQIDVVGLDVTDGSADAAQLRQIAEVTGRRYRSAKDAMELNNYFREQGEAIRKTNEAAIFRALADDIRAAREERERDRNEALAHSQELYDRYQELQTQFQRAANATMPCSTP